MLVTDVLQKFGFSRTQSKFKTGDHVEPINGGELMVVQAISVCKKSNSLQLSCKWFDSQLRQNRTGIFSEGQIRLFNWYNANRSAYLVSHASVRA
jgi:uncharacterized protein YodC (DUF2158 family)